MQINEIQNIKFNGANGRQSLLDVIHPAKAANLPVLIFAHGFKGYKDWGHFPILATQLASAGFVVVKFNFSHNGGTIDDPIDFPDLNAFAENTYSKEQEDLDEIIKWVVDENDLPNSLMDKSKIYLMGHSRGGSMVIIKAAKDHRVKKVISLAAVSDLLKRLPNEEDMKAWKERGVRSIKNGRTKQDMPMNYDFVKDLLSHEEELSVESACREMNIPQLIIHGDNDEAVPLEMAKDLKKWNPKAKLEIIESTGHTFGGKHPWNEKDLPVATRIVVDKVLAFLKEN